MDKWKLAVAVFYVAVLTATVYAAYKAWQWTTTITLMGPIQVETDLPQALLAYPGTYSYTVNVANRRNVGQLILFCYTVTVENCNVEVAPANETQYVVPAGQTISIPVNIALSLVEGQVQGAATIHWWITV